MTAPKGGRKIALRDFFTVLALSFHSVFEGLAIGLEPTTDHVILLFAGSIFVMSDFHKREISLSNDNHIEIIFRHSNIKMILFVRSYRLT